MIILLLIIIALYWLPTIIGAVRHVPNLGTVIIVDLFLGWTLVGWVVALVFACREIPADPYRPPLPRQFDYQAEEKWRQAMAGWRAADPAVRGPEPALDAFMLPAPAAAETGADVTRQQARSAEKAYWAAYAAWEKADLRLRGPKPDWADYRAR